MKKLLIGLVVIMSISTLALTGCGGSDLAAQAGDQVAVHYTGTLDDGSKFDSSHDRGETLDFTVGAGQMIAGFDEAVVGMKEGDVKTVTLPPEEAYGPVDPNMIISLPRDEFPADMTIEIGQQVPLSSSAGGVVLAVITDITADAVTLDANHRLAGKTLHFEIEMVKITRP